ncbi:hypothetical protein [Micromonospora sp. CPCC 205561]|uniref:hypothetical protein n=1 Tax=Micromonospora sp. CPCC 205561 TaxID=3122407 RepID=UPI002FEF1A1D
MAEPDTDRKSSDAEGWQSNAWAWPIGIMLGLVLGLAALDGAAGIWFGVSIGIAFAVALGAGSRSGTDDDDDADADAHADDEATDADGKRPGGASDARERHDANDAGDRPGGEPDAHGRRGRDAGRGPAGQGFDERPAARQRPDRSS